MNRRQTPPDSDSLQPFLEGREIRAWKLLGCHRRDAGHHFRVWAPRAAGVSLVGDFNDWNKDSHPMTSLGNGVWELWTDGLKQDSVYQFAVRTANGRVLIKSDPYAFHTQLRPHTASRPFALEGYPWGDQHWLTYRASHPACPNPLNIYEVHLGSWRRSGQGEFLSYREMAPYLIPYVKQMGFTHVELMPITEHPQDDSWGYQCTGYFAATSRFGTPHDLMYLIDQLHQAGIGVILDWVPAQLPRDEAGLCQFDGTPAYEYDTPGQQTGVFHFGRGPVRSFLFSSAMFWLEEFHIDGLRVDAVSSLLCLPGQEHQEAADFLCQLNGHILANHPDVITIAGRSLRPHSADGPDFTLKWDLDWTSDLLHYAKLEPGARSLCHRDITPSPAASHQSILPFCHNEVVDRKGSLVGKMPGPDEEKFAGVRAFYTYVLTYPGKKLTMMGSEFGQRQEWHYEHSLDWHLLELDNQEGVRHRALQTFFREANALYLSQPALWENDGDPASFQWLCADDCQGSCVAFLRRDLKGKPLVVLCNFSQVHQETYRLGVPYPGGYRCLLSTEEPRFGGSGLGSREELTTHTVPCHGQAQSLVVDLPPMSALILRCSKRLPPRNGHGIKTERKPD